MVTLIKGIFSNFTFFSTFKLQPIQAPPSSTIKMVKQNFVGMVISHGKMNKTVKVRVQRMKFNKLVNKDVVRFTDFLVHDEANKCKEGDVVRIQYVRPLSARKSFAVSEILMNKGLSWIKYREEAPGKVAAEELTKIAEYKEERSKRLGQDGYETTAQQMDNLRKINLLSIRHDRKPEDEDWVTKTMQKYQIPSWPNETKIFDLEVDQLRKELEDLSVEIKNSSFSSFTIDLMENKPEEVNNILRSLGKADPEKLAKNIKKNILMKHFVKTLAKPLSSTA